MLDTPLFPPDAFPWPPDDDAVRAAMEQAYATGAWGRYAGPYREQLEAELARQAGTPHAWACCSGTFALELALRALPVGPGDEVVLAGYDFAGSFRAIEAVGARPVLADIDPDTWSLSVESLEQALGPACRAVVVSHLHGGTAPMPRLMELARRRNLAVVEDACQIPGGLVAGRPAGSWGDVGVFSFGGSKLLTCGRGGGIVTASGEVHQRAKIYCERGNDAFPLSELQAAVLLPQLASLAERNATRRANAARLAREVRSPGLRVVQTASENDQPSYYKLGWQVLGPEEEVERRRAALVALAQQAGLPLDVGFRGFARRPESRCRRGDALPQSRRAAAGTVVLHHPALLVDEDTISRLAAGLNQVLLFWQAAHWENANDEPDVQGGADHGAQRPSAPG